MGRPKWIWYGVEINRHFCNVNQHSSSGNRHMLIHKLCAQKPHNFYINLYIFGLINTLYTYVFAITSRILLMEIVVTEIPISVPGSITNITTANKKCIR